MLAVTCNGGQSHRFIEINISRYGNATNVGLIRAGEITKGRAIVTGN